MKKSAKYYRNFNEILPQVAAAKKFKKGKITRFKNLQVNIQSMNINTQALNITQALKYWKLYIADVTLIFL